jgi:hypothetical protein
MFLGLDSNPPSVTEVVTNDKTPCEIRDHRWDIKRPVGSGVPQRKAGILSDFRVCPTSGSITLRDSVGDRSGDVFYLLGGRRLRKDASTGQFSVGPKEKWKPDMEAVKATIRFLENTSRLTHQPLAE